MNSVSNIVEQLREIHDPDGAWHGPSLHKILSGVTFQMALRKPVSSFRSIWELVLHISKWEEVFCLRLEGQTIREPADGDWPVVTDSSDAGWQKTLEFMDKTHNRLIQIVSRFNDSDLERQVPGKDFSIGYMLNGIVRHHVYHSGQIALLKRMV